MNTCPAYIYIYLGMNKRSTLYYYMRALLDRAVSSFVASLSVQQQLIQQSAARVTIDYL